MESIFNNKKKFIFLLTLYKIISDNIYIKIISPLFINEGFSNFTSLKTQIFSWIIFYISTFFIFKILKNNQRASSFIICILYFLSFIPFTTCVNAGVFNINYVIANTTYWLLLLIISLHLKQKNINSKELKIYINKKCINKNIIGIVAFASVVIVLFTSLFFTNFRLNFNLLGVYDLRREAVVARLPIVISYFFDWTRAVNPFFIVYSIINKSILGVIYFFSQMLSFGVDGLKSTFFMAIFAAHMYIYKHNISLKN